MSREIRALQVGDWAIAAVIRAKAYPGAASLAEEALAQAEQDMLMMNGWTGLTYYGLFEDEQLLGVMRFHDFQMNLLGKRVLVGGVGGVAVDLLRKKEKVARDLVLFYLRHYREQGACLTALYPFRPDFYKQMGFGYGTKANLYEFVVQGLSNGRSKAHLSLLDKKDLPLLEACHQRYWQRTHGLFERTTEEWERVFRQKEWQVLGYKDGEALLGYLIFNFQKGESGGFLDNDLVVQEWVWEQPVVFAEQAAFLQTQGDQVTRVIYNTQSDDFHLALTDPRARNSVLLSPPSHTSNVQAVGIMYRVIDVPRLFELLADHDFGGVSCRLKIKLRDSLLPENEGEYVVAFVDGKATMMIDTAVYDVAIEIDVAEFSSLVVGAATFARLYQYGLVKILAEITLSSLETAVFLLNRLFAVAEKPICLSRF